MNEKRPRPIQIIGVDAATDVKRIGLSRADVVGDRCVLGEALCGLDPVDQLTRWMSHSPETVLIAVDAPLGWPDALGTALSEHRAGEPLALPRHEANRLFRRLTDVLIKERLGKQPLDVGADRIARTAHSILCRLGEFAKSQHQPGIDLAWQADLKPGIYLIEVYPAATLTALSAPATGYKKKNSDAAAVRAAILSMLKEEMEIEVDDEVVLQNDDALDAAICALAGYDFLRGLAVAPELEQMERARKEGWIWCRMGKE